MAFGSAPRGIPRILQWLLAGLMTLIGLAVGGLGLKLVTVGGSGYFLIMGVAMVIAAVLIFINRASGIVLYGIAFIASLFWAVSDADGISGRSSRALYVCRAGLPLCHRLAVYARSKPQRPEQSTRVWRCGRSGGRDAGEPRLDVQAANAGGGE